MLDLIFGYDGLGRIFGGSGGQGGGPGGASGGGGFGGTPGILRLANSEFATQITWLLPFAGLSLVSGLFIRARTARTDRARAGYLMWGLWLGVHAFVFSYMSSIIHSYYTIVMARPWERSSAPAWSSCGACVPASHGADRFSARGSLLRPGGRHTCSTSLPR